MFAAEGGGKVKQKRIKVYGDRMQATARRIEDHVDGFERNYKLLYDIVDATGAYWQGADYQAYVQQISGYRDDLDRIAKQLRGYAKLITKSSREYMSLRARLEQQAQRSSK